MGHFEVFCQFHRFVNNKYCKLLYFFDNLCISVPVSVILLYNFKVKIDFLEFQNLERGIIFLSVPGPTKS